MNKNTAELIASLARRCIKVLMIARRSMQQQSENSRNHILDSHRMEVLVLLVMMAGAGDVVSGV